jgi:ferredoxin-thioredoxin reductase catalytic subunit
MSAGPTLPDPAAVERRHAELTEQAAASGYNLTPDAQFARDLVRGLLVNQARYGYEACPCRFANGTRADDRDIICPCDYRDDDLAEHGSCY